MPAVSRFLPSARSVLVAVLIAALGAGAYIGARETTVFAVTKIEVGGAPEPISRDVRRALAPLRGSSLVVVDRAELERRVADLAWVAGLRYDRAFPHTLRVWIETERALAVLRRGARSWLVSARGRVLQPVDRASHRRLPRIWLGADGAPRVGARVPEQASAAVAALAPAAGLPFLERVLFVRVGEQTVTLVLRSGVEVRLGEPSDVRLKVEIARRILPSVVSPGYVDLSVPERPVVGGNPQVEG